MFISFSAVKISNCNQTYGVDAIVASIVSSRSFLLTHQCLFIHFFSFFPDLFISFNYFMLHMLLFLVAVVPHMLALPSCTGPLVSSFSTFQ